MGKALVFSGVTITNPLTTVNFSDGLSTVVRNYVGKLSTSVSEAKAQAFQTFYETLNNAGIWDKITCLYPMYGSASDCAYGMKGDDLTIPSGATYEKGINLTSATGGFGAAGKGIKLLDMFPSTATTNYSMFVNYPNDWTSAQRGYPLVFASDSTRQAASSAGRFLGQSYANDNGWMNMKASLAGDAGELRYAVTSGKGLFGETHSFTSNAIGHYLYFDGTAVRSVTSGYTSVNDNGKLGINATAQTGVDTHLLNVPINMVIVCNGNALSSTEVATLNTAVKTLSNAIFG